MQYPKRTKYVIGIDEVGRGPLAGPVTLCAFCVPVHALSQVAKQLNMVTDSKKLSKKKRERCEKIIREVSNQGKASYTFASISAKIIDQKGMSYAINVALKRVLTKLPVSPSDSYVYLDGSLYAPTNYPQETIIKGDLYNWLISSASILAKTYRDRTMQRYAKKYPVYGFGAHMGYGTLTHRLRIKKYGPCDIHRKTWIH